MAAEADQGFKAHVDPTRTAAFAGLVCWPAQSITNDTKP
jgi:hypothetical protein